MMSQPIPRKSWARWFADDVKAKRPLKRHLAILRSAEQDDRVRWDVFAPDYYNLQAGLHTVQNSTKAVELHG